MRTTENENWFRVEKGWILTDKSGHKSGYYYNSLDRAVRISNTSKTFNYHLKIVGSTFPLEGIPLIVMEDEVEKLACSIYGTSIYSIEEVEAFKNGYNQAKSKYKYTEENLVDLLHFVIDKSSNLSSEDFRKATYEEIVQLFINQPKEIEFEMEEYAVGSYGMSDG